MSSRNVILILIFLLLISIPAGSASVQVVASSSIKASNDTEHIHNNGENGWFVLSGIGQGYDVAIPENITGNYNIFYSEVGTVWAAHIQVFKNGEAIGAFNPLSGSYTNHTDLITGQLNTTDILELRYESINSENGIEKNFRLMYDYGYAFTGGNLSDTWGYGQKYDVRGNTTLDNTTIRRCCTLNMELNLTPDDYILYHSFDEGIGSTSHDENSTIQSNGILYNSVGWNNGFNGGNASSFVHGTSLINLSNNSKLSGMSQFSIFARVNLSSVSASTQYTVLSSWSATSNRALLLRYNTACTSNHCFQFYLQNTSHQNQATTSFVGTNISGTINTWHDVVVTYNGSYIVVNLDGVNSTTSAPQTGSVDITINDTYIGNSPHSIANHAWNGLIDDVYIFDRVISPTELIAIRNRNHSVVGNVTTNTEQLNGTFTGFNITGNPLPAGTNISVYINTSWDNISWSGDILTTPQATLGLNYGIPDSSKQRFYQFRLNYNSTNTSLTPSISRINVYEDTTFSFVSPTVINAKEPWNTRNMSINVTGTLALSNVTLHLSSGHYYDKITTNYTMDIQSSTNWEKNFTGLDDDVYSYYVSGDYSGTTYTSATIWTQIDLSLPTGFNNKTLNNIFLMNFSNGQYYSSMNNFSYTEPIMGIGNLVERQYTTWNFTSEPRMITLYRCYNAGSNYYYDDTTCTGGDTATSLGLILNLSNQNIRTVPLNRYKFNNTRYVTLADTTNIPSGYSFEKTLGYTLRSTPHREDIVYINNSKIKIGFDMKYGASIIYISNNLSGNFYQNVVTDENWVNNADCGRQIQNDYYTDGLTAISYSNPFQRDWNPLTGGNEYCEPPTILAAVVTLSSIYYRENAKNFVPDWGMNNSQMELITTYSMDGENPVILMNYSYINHGVSHSILATQVADPTNNSVHPQGSAGGMVTGDVTYGYKFYNLTSNQLQNITSYGKNATCDGTMQAPPWSQYTVCIGEIGYINGSLFAGVYNQSSFGLGFWDWGVSRIQWHNGSFANESTFDWPYFFIATQPWFGVMANSSGSHYGRLFLGSASDAQTYFTSLEYGVDFDPSTFINQTVTNQNYLNIKVNTTDIAQIKNSTLIWTNATGTYQLSMSIDGANLSATKNMTGLSSYNLTYYVDTNSTTGVRAITNVVWTNLLTDTLPPTSITNLANTTGSTYINWTWTDPADSDFDHVEVYLDNISKPNVSKGLQYFNASGLTPLTSYTIGTHTVDTSGNVNATWVNNTAMTLVAPDVTGTIIAVRQQPAKIYRRI